MPWLCVQSSSFGPFQRATAHDGPIEAWAIYGLVYDARSCFAPRALAVGVDLFLRDDALGDVLLQPGVDIRRHRRRLFPPGLRAQLGRRRDRILFALGEDAEEAAVANYGNALGFADAQESGKPMRRPNHAPMQHPRQHQIVHVARLAGELRRQVAPRRAAADQAIGRCRLERRGARDLALDVREIPVGDAALGTADGAVFDRQLMGSCLENRRGAPEHQRAQLGARHAQRLAAILDRQAAGGHAFVRAVGGARRKDANSLQIDIQLFGGDLRKRREDALPELDLAARDGDRAVGARSARAATGGARRTARSASQRASRIALTTRLCEPQRQRFLSRAARISLFPGFGILRKQSATAAMTMPLMQ